jgi:hypothetical protein
VLCPPPLWIICYEFTRFPSVTVFTEQFYGKEA